MPLYENETRPQRALLVSLDTGEFDAQASLRELEELSRTAGADPVLTLTQKRPAPDTATCLGSGMVEQAAELCRQEEIDLLLFDRELTPTQIRNLEKACQVRVIDRTTLILDIFAQRARSKEGKLQVELAQLRYLLPRLGGQGTALSRLGGGIGTRGPGETKLETDRRHIRRRIGSLKEQLKEVEAARGVIDRRRKKDGTVTVALVGYTNAGKSTLMNQLTQAGVLAEDKLFATLDPTARALKLPCGKTVMLIDTVLQVHLGAGGNGGYPFERLRRLQWGGPGAPGGDGPAFERAGRRRAPHYPRAEQVGRRGGPGPGPPPAWRGAHQRPDRGGHPGAVGSCGRRPAGKDLPRGAAAALCQNGLGRQAAGGRGRALGGVCARRPAALRPGG